jgi:hypothetical protein
LATHAAIDRLTANSSTYHSHFYDYDEKGFYKEGRAQIEEDGGCD